MNDSLSRLLDDISRCRICEASLPLGPRPVVRASSNAKILIIGQAPSTKVHASGLPWDDASGKRLRNWLGVSPEQFYDEKQIAIIPMGFCYPGKGKSGDLPPRPECAPRWHEALLKQLPQRKLTLLIGQYAQRYYLTKGYASLTENVRQWQQFGPTIMPLPHPSPRNRLWLRNNPWFEQQVIPQLQQALCTILNKGTTP